MLFGSPQISNWRLGSSRETGRATIAVLDWRAEAVVAVDPTQPAESFRGLLLRHRGRTGLTQAQLADRLGLNRRSIQDWESGVNHPSAERLQGLLAALLEAGGLSLGQEAEEAHALWAAVERDAARMRTPFDSVWFARLLAHRTTPQAAAESAAPERRQDWGEAPDILGFVGRSEDLDTLRTCVLDERCRLVAIVGIGGVGKTSLTARVAHEVAPSFERVYWRSLRDAPPASDWLGGAIGFLSDQQVVPPPRESERITALLQLLRDCRCLLVLDNFETIYTPGQEEGRYRPGGEGYGRVLQAVGETMPQSCLMLTSRETPPELRLLSGSAVRRYPLGGLSVEEAQVLLAAKHLAGSSTQWAELIDRFAGNGLALKMVAETIRELFEGDIGAFLDEAGGGSLYGGIRRLLAEQVERSSLAEQRVLTMLAVEREPLPLSVLLGALGPRIGRANVLEAVEALRRRSLVERLQTAGAAAFTLQSVVMEYMTDRLVEAGAREIQLGQPALLVEQPLIQATAEDYTRQSQERLIGEPILRQLNSDHAEGGPEHRLLALLKGWRGRPASQQGFGPGNVVNLLRLLRGHLRGLDLSQLTIRQAYLAAVSAQDASIADAELAESVLADAFTLPVSVALSDDGALLAVGTTTGELWLWRVADRTLLATLEGHTGVVWCVALSADGRLIASGSDDRTVRIWDAHDWRLQSTLQAHTSGVASVALSADGELLASTGIEGTVKLWEVSTQRLLATMEGHSSVARGVALSADGQLVASSGEDGTVRLWDTRTGRLSAVLQGHTGGVWSVAVSADGHLVASGSADGTARLWDAGGAQPVATLKGHTSVVWRVAVSADGRLVATASQDGTVRLWDTSAAAPVATLQGHTSGVWGVSLSGDGERVASGGADGTVRLWGARGARPLASLQGHTNGVWAVALTRDGRLLGSGGQDGTAHLWDAHGDRPSSVIEAHAGGTWSVAFAADARLMATGGADGHLRLWDPGTARLRSTLRAHTSVVWSVSLSDDGRALASASEDGSVGLWNTETGRLVTTLRSHSGGVWCVALSPDARLVASGGADATARLWDASTAQLIATLEGHTSGLWSVAFGAEGSLLASGSEDGTLRVWDARAGRLLQTLQGHTGVVLSVALSRDGQLLASGGGDGTVRLWDPGTGQPLHILQGHTSAVRAVALGEDAHVVVSGGFDGTVRLWDTRSGDRLRTLRSERRYERLDITGLSGITDAQRQALIALGAVDRSA